MKNSISIFFFLLISIPLLAQNNEEKAIIEVIEKGHYAFCAKNFEKYTTCFDQSDKLIWGDGISFACKGWTEVEKLVKPWMESNPDPIEPSIFYNYQISVAENKAWATFDKKDKGESTPISKEQRILVKKNGEWKLVGMLFFSI